MLLYSFDRAPKPHYVQHRYFAHVFGKLDPEADCVVLRKDLLNEEDDDLLDEEPLTMISYQTMRSIVDFFEQGTLKIVEHNVKASKQGCQRTQKSEC